MVPPDRCPGCRARHSRISELLIVIQKIAEVKPDSLEMSSVGGNECYLSLVECVGEARAALGGPGAGEQTGWPPRRESPPMIPPHVCPDCGAPCDCNIYVNGSCLHQTLHGDD